MKTIKSGLGLVQLLMCLVVVAILMALTPQAQAQNSTQYTPTTLSLTNVIAASSTLTATNVITATKRENVTYAVSFNLSGTGVGNVITSWAKGVDGTNFETTPSVTMTNAANGTNSVVGYGNTSMGAGGYLKLVSIQNVNTPSTITNLAVKVATKPGY